MQRAPDIDENVLRASLKRAVDCIIPSRLYLGDFRGRQFPDTLKRAGVTHVVAVLDKDVPHVALPPHMTEKRFELEDSKHETRFPAVMTEAVAYLDDVLRNNSAACVFVHCGQGMSRSAAVVVAYLMHAVYRDETPQQVFERVSNARPCVDINPIFEKVLMEWDKKGRVLCLK